MSVDIEPILNARKPRYTVLKEELFPHTHNYEFARVYIDLDCLIAALYDDRVVENFDSVIKNKPMALAASVLNTAAHYRHYLWSRVGIAADIYMYYESERATRECELVETFKKKHYTKRGIIDANTDRKEVRDYVLRNLNGANKVGEFLPNIHVIKSTDINPDAIPGFLMREFAPAEDLKILDIVISNELPMLQYCNRPDTIVMTMKGDRTRTIVAENMLDEIQKRSKVKDTEYKFSSTLFPIITSLAGDLRYSVDGLPKVRHKKALELIDKLYTDGAITDEVTEMSVFLERVSTDVISQDKRQAIINAHAVLDVDVARQNISTVQATRILTQLVEKRDWEGVHRINDSWFGNYPLNIEYIMDGES